MTITVRLDGGADGHKEVVRLRELVETLTERNRQLEHALESRIVIEQAKGVLAERLGVPPDEAFELIRRAARRNRLRLRDLAHEVVSTRQTPDAIFGPRTPQRVSD
jgi:AmiR/NasT family two-component response regulator